MHEMGIASSILDAVEKETPLHPGHRAVKVGVVIGEYAGIDAESLRFGFEVIARDRDLELAIEWRLASDELKLAYLEMEEVSNGQSDPREKCPERERSHSGAAA
jgi:Zn finger protein HypA/HybF involved in hydrogenase expression